MIWFTSDTHFCHRNIIGFCSRPFADCDEMDATLVTNWNTRVSKDDTVYHLGDFAVTYGKKRCQRALDILSRLEGQKWLIKGNHDRKEVYDSTLWQHVRDYHEMSVGGLSVVLSHYPMRSWRGSHRGSVMLHGHCHGTIEPIRNQIDVGVDCNEFRPVSIEEIKARLS